MHKPNISFELWYDYLWRLAVSSYLEIQDDEDYWLKVYDKELTPQDALGV